MYCFKRITAGRRKVRLGEAIVVVWNSKTSTLSWNQSMIALRQLTTLMGSYPAFNIRAPDRLLLKTPSPGVHPLSI